MLLNRYDRPEMLVLTLPFIKDHTVEMLDRRFKYLLIDLDGTLTDSKEGIHACIRFALAQLGRPIAEDVNLDWTIGPPLKASLAKLLDTTDDQLVERALLAYRERFSTIGLFENQVYDSVPETLFALKQRGYTLFVATAKPTIYAKRILEHFKINQFFCEIYGSELSGERADKRELIAYILQEQRLKSIEGLMIGDRDCDILAARSNNMQAIAARYGYGTAQEIDALKPFAEISRFADLLDLVV